MIKKDLVQDAIRFIIGGIVNTGITYLVFLITLNFMRYEYAYSLSWLAGILFILTFYPSKVFVGSKSTPKKLLITAVQYLLVFICGLVFLRIFVNKAGIPEYIAIAFVIVATTLINFLLMRLVFRKLKMD
jgi:putative flippase GtrA